MSDPLLFKEEAFGHVPASVRCSCKKKIIDGISHKLPPQYQPRVYLYPSLDPKWLVGRCTRCGIASQKRIG